MVSRSLTVTNREGLHIMIANSLTKAAESCSSSVEILLGRMRIDCKSILNLLSGNIRYGTTITLCCTGPEEEKDLDFMTEKFTELLITQE